MASRSGGSKPSYLKNKDLEDDYLSEDDGEKSVNNGH